MRYIIADSGKEVSIMKKRIAAVIAGIAAAVLMAGTAYAGEFVDINGRRFYNTGYDHVLTGWRWIVGTDGKAKCYLFDNSGYCYTNTVTPDGYTVDEWGQWTYNGQVVTKDYEAGMERETDYSTAGGAYHTTRQEYADGSVNYYGPNDFPATVTFQGGCAVTTYYAGGQNTDYFYNYFTQYSYESESRRQALDFIDENNFRVLDFDQGTVTFYSR